LNHIRVKFESHPSRSGRYGARLSTHRARERPGGENAAEEVDPGPGGEGRELHVQVQQAAAEQARRHGLNTHTHTRTHARTCTHTHSLSLPLSLSFSHFLEQARRHGLPGTGSGGGERGRGGRRRETQRRRAATVTDGAEGRDGRRLPRACSPNARTRRSTRLDKARGSFHAHLTRV
jgi:hypothetical protein